MKSVKYKLLTRLITIVNDDECDFWANNHQQNALKNFIFELWFDAKE